VFSEQKHTPETVKLWESPSRAGGLPIIIKNPEYPVHLCEIIFVSEEYFYLFRQLLESLAMFCINFSHHFFESKFSFYKF